MNADLALLAQDPTALEQTADPVQFVVLAMERAKAWLTQALEHGDIDQIVELKSQAEAIRVYTAQKQIGKDAELAAAEIVRRAERGIGIAIRRGQEAGTIATRADGGWNARNLDGRDAAKDSPDQFFTGGHSERTNAYAVTDGVTQDQFDQAIDQAKAEGNLSRANVVRKVRGEPGPVIDRPEILRKTRRIDSNRVIEQTINGANPNVGGVLELVDFAALDGDRLEEWIGSLSSHIKGLRRLCTELEKELTRRDAV